MAHHNQHDVRMSTAAPTHPVPQLQGPFEESMLESVYDDPLPDTFLDPVARRNTLLEAPTYTRICAGRWKQKPGERFHPLWKLIAQISFGIHLLAEGMAKSEDEVMQILQAHVDEIDGFLERTTEDFDLAQDDVAERLRCLKLPLSHPATFEKMLEDRNFRLSIVEGNEKIEHIVVRTKLAMKDSLKDVQKGFDSTGCLETYLQGLHHRWHRHSVEHEAVWVAMLGNVEGWRKAFTALHMQGNKLGGSLKKLTDIINEMQARAGEVSRRLLHQARLQHPQSMGRPTGRNAPTSRFQTLPNKQLPGMPADRPSLRQTVSHDSARTQTSSRPSSSKALQQLARSVTPQSGMPAPQQVRNTASPRIVQIGHQAQGRVQSMVPSLFGAPPPSDSTTNLQHGAIKEDETSGRYFPPIELPAHVPEETMRQAPMSKQNRLSIGLGLNQGNRADNRNSRLGTTGLVGLLRSSPNVSRSNGGSPKSPRSPEVSRRASVVRTAARDDLPAGHNPTPPRLSQTRSSSTSDTRMAVHTTNNLRRPSKGVQHWSDALEDDLGHNNKHSVQENTSSQTIQTTVLTTTKAPHSDHGSQPGTPSWAKTKFAHTQVEKKKAELKRGAFNSHPPDLPLASPPMQEAATVQNLSTVSEQRRRPSHASSAGTLGEPGPEISGSDTASLAAWSALNQNPNNNAWKRASAAAPEVLSVEKKTGPISSAKKPFIAEMEGSIPMMSATMKFNEDPGLAMELEAPQQYFRLPPRPQPSAVPATSLQAEGHEHRREHQQYSELPPRPQESESNVAKQDTPLPKPQPVETKDEPVFDASQPGPPSQDTVITEGVGTSTPAHTFPPTVTEPARVEEVIDSSIGLQEVENRLSSNMNVPTPGISLPPSPLESETYNETQEVAEPQKQEETLFLLPAMTYKPPSPSLPPDPWRRSRESAARATSPFARTSAVSDKFVDTQQSAIPPQEQKEDTTSEPQATEASPKTDDISAQNQTELWTDALQAEPQAEQNINLSASPRIGLKFNTQTGDLEDIEAGQYVSKTMQCDQHPPTLKHARNSSSHGSQNGWKAFFTGQPSPAGSNLSIRSIKRESALEQRQSPTLLNSDSASTRFTPSPQLSQSASPAAEPNVKDVAWFHTTVDEVRTPPTQTSAPSANVQMKSEGVADEGLGLGITNAGNDDTIKRTTSAGSRCLT